MEDVKRPLVMALWGHYVVDYAAMTFLGWFALTPHPQRPIAEAPPRLQALIDTCGATVCDPPRRTPHAPVAARRFTTLLWRTKILVFPETNASDRTPRPRRQPNSATRCSSNACIRAHRPHILDPSHNSACVASARIGSRRPCCHSGPCVYRREIRFFRSASIQPRHSQTAALPPTTQRALPAITGFFTKQRPTLHPSDVIHRTVEPGRTPSALFGLLRDNNKSFLSVPRRRIRPTNHSSRSARFFCAGTLLSSLA